MQLEYNVYMKTDTMNSFNLPEYQEIPDIGLYLDQVARYINSFLADFPEMNVTPSMISNYAKQKLIERVNKKTYTRDQITTLFLIVLFKNVLSIEHIRTLLNQEKEKECSISDMYTAFRSTLLMTCRNENEAPFSNDILYHIAVALAKKMYLERYFETD